MLSRKRRGEDLTLELRKFEYRPRSVAEAQKALELGAIEISQYVEFSLSMEPAVDALSDPDPAIRRKAIFQLLKHKNRSWAVAKLRELILEGDEDSRLYASQALDQLDKAYFEAFQRLESRLENAFVSGDALLYALLCLDYYNSGLPGETLGHWYLMRAIRLVNEVIESHTPSAQAFHVRGKLWKALGEPSKAVRDLREALRLRPMEPKIYLDLAEAFYLLGDYHSAAHSCRYASQAPLPEELDEVVNYWVDSGNR